MSQQFNLKRFDNGDIGILGGVLVDLTSSPTETFLFGITDVSGISTDPDTDSFVSPPSLSGGSGRNIYIFRTGSQTDIPFGSFFPLTNNKWANANGYDFTIEVNPSNGQILIKDSVGTVAIAPLGSFRLHERAACASAQASGGPGTSVKTIDLGGGTGTVNLTYESFGYDSTFTVVWNSNQVINVTGTGTASFSKNISGITSATVTVVGDEYSDWSYTLGCPGTGSSPPYVHPAIGTPDSFTAASTAYGNTLNGGVAFNLSCRFENGAQEKTASTESEYIPFRDEQGFTQDGYQRYYDNQYKEFEILIKSTGAEIRDATDAIAIRPINDINSVNLTDPTGVYESTAHGMSRFQVDEPFFIEITSDQSKSISGTHYYLVRLSSGLLSYVDGPIFYQSSLLPSNTSTLKHIPIGEYDASTNTLLQLWEGPILWR